MKITQDAVVDNQATLHIELDDADLDPFLDQGYQRVRQQIAIPGFRRGRVPRRIVERMMGRDALLNEALEEMVNTCVYKAIEDQELNAVGQPKVESVDLQEPVRFTAIVPLRPEIDLGDYASIRVEYDPPMVADEDVNERLEAIRQSLGTWETVERPLRFEDLAAVDLRGESEDGRTWDFEDRPLYLAEDGIFPVPGFTSRIVGMSVGETSEFTIDPDDGHADAPDESADSAARASFTVTVKEVRERSLPELTDEFAQSLPDGFADLQALVSAVRGAMTTEITEMVEGSYRESVIDALLEGVSMTVPEVIIENQIDFLEERLRASLEDGSVRMDDYLASIGKTEEEHQEITREAAEKSVRSQLAMDELSEREGVSVADEEIDERFGEIYGGRRMRARDRRAARENLSSQIKSEKTLQLLLSIAKGERDRNGAQAAEAGSQESDNPPDPNEETSPDTEGRDDPPA